MHKDIGSEQNTPLLNHNQQFRQFVQKYTRLVTQNVKYFQTDIIVNNLYNLMNNIKPYLHYFLILIFSMNFL